ncbi:hypothetical protein FRC11_007217 [Ceratobasidium sp. 423]|nr:hypothetical protein FRC11_007217 [Ceratobasidium sp. 423]
MNAWLRNNKEVEDLEAIFLREVLEDNEDYTKTVMNYDPYCSDLLAIDFLTKGHRKRAGVIAYPMGRNFDSLGASALFDEKWGSVFSPGEKPGWKAPSSILQITNSNAIYKPSATSYTRAGCLFAVRTLFDVNFICIAPKPGATVVARQSLISSFGQADIGGRRPFHLAFNPHEQTHAGLVVSDIGVIWSFGLDSKPSLLYSQTDDSTARVGAYDLPYWGLGWGAHPETFLLGSHSMLSLYDKRVSKVASVLPMASETMTSFDTLRSESFSQIFISGTEHVTLVDERMMGRPVVSWVHHRDSDMTLRIKALELEQKKVGLLTSKRSSFISVYDPLLSESEGLEGCDSYGLEWDSPNSCVSASITVYIPPTTARPTLFHLSNSGAIYRQDMGIGPCEPSVERVVWEHELKNLAEKVEFEHEQYDDEDLTKYREVNLRYKYEETFMNNNLDAGGPSVTEVVDLAPTVFQRANEPVDKPMILHDLLLIRDDDDMLSVAASALTLEGIEPPHVQHVQPCPTQGLIDGKQGAEQRQSLVVRLLASEWDPDSSPSDYEFHDPYNQDYDEAMPAWKLMAQTKADKQSLERAKSRFLSSRTTIAPARSVPLPPIQISRSKPPMIPNPAAVQRQAESQPELIPNQTMSSQPRGPPSSQMNGSSQLPSTQIVPGPFGARPGTSAAPKKKKSRLPGF